jgi:hypothetical protein
VSHARKRECEEIIVEGELACCKADSSSYERNCKNTKIGLVLKKKDAMQKDRKLMGQRRKWFAGE